MTDLMMRMRQGDRDVLASFMAERAELIAEVGVRKADAQLARKYNARCFNPAPIELPPELDEEWSAEEEWSEEEGKH